MLLKNKTKKNNNSQTVIAMFQGCYLFIIFSSVLAEQSASNTPLVFAVENLNGFGIFGG